MALSHNRWLTASRALVVAHRGASASAPENTLAAFRLAAEQEADAVELDVQQTRDGHLVVIHDAAPGRTTSGTGEIAQMRLDEVRALDAGGWYGPAFAGERIPTLDEVLTVLRGRLLVDIELKAPDIGRPVLDLVRNLEMRDQILISSFDEAALATVCALDPEVATGLLQQRPALERAGALGVQVYLPNIGVLAPAVVTACRERGLRLIPWTARTEAEAARALGLGVDGIIADDPVMVRRVMHQH